MTNTICHSFHVAISSLFLEINPIFFFPLKAVIFLDFNVKKYFQNNVIFTENLSLLYASSNFFVCWRIGKIPNSGESLLEGE